MTVSPNRIYYPALDQLRGFAAALVMFYHGFELIGSKLAGYASFDGKTQWVYTRNPFIALLQEGHTGVAMFIVLSGFVLSLGALGRSIIYPKFLAARFLRIYPLLIVCLAAALIADPNLPRDPKTIFISLIPLSVAGNIQSVFTTMFWAVVIEFQCYLLFPFIIRLSNAYGVKALLALVLAVIALRLMVFIIQPTGTARDLSYATIFGRLDQFLIGIMTAKLYVDGRLAWAGSKSLGFSAAAVLGLMTLYNQAGGAPADGTWKLFWPTLEAMMWACFIISYFKASAGWANRFSTWAAKLGEISYSTYLWHFAIIAGVIAARWFVAPTGWPHTDAVLTTLLIVFPLTIAVGIVSYALIERPFLKLRPKYLRTLPPKQP